MASGSTIERFIEEHRASFLLALLGIFLLGIGALSAVVLSLNQRKPQVEILSTQEETPSNEQPIVVDVAGAVNEPGIYEFPAGSRVNDALKKAGGLAEGADEDWISKYINLAQTLSDGVKIYVPSVGEKLSAENSGAAAQDGAVIGISSKTKINVNSALASELENLWGIGEKRAADIIANRPYTDLTELMSRAKIPKNVYERIENEISLF